MNPVVINGELWKFDIVSPDDPLLIDRTGYYRLATTDPTMRMIRLSSEISLPQLDKVVLHEIAHAITISYNLLGYLRAIVPEDLWVFTEEWAAQLVENHALEAVDLASVALGRPACIDNRCY